jgi:purine-binding chemotaxis protein CheW
MGMERTASNGAVQAEGQAPRKYLAFLLSRERYGIQILNIQEIIKVPNITLVPQSPRYMKGVINLRGKIIPVVDLRLKFGMDPRDYDQRTCIIVVNLQRNDQTIAVGVVVDMVLEVVTFVDSEVESPPHFGSHVETGFIIGMGKKDEQLNILLDIDKIISDTEINIESAITT